MVILPSFNKRIKDQIKQTLVWITLTLIVSLSLSYGVLMLEMDNGSHMDNIQEMWWWWVLTITGLGSADVSPISLEGRALASLVIISGLVLFAIVVSQVASIMRLTYERKEKGIIRVNYTNHIIIFGYTSLTAGVVKLLRNHFGKDLKILLITNDTNFNPFPKEVDFLFGNPIDRDTFVEANAYKAMACIILANDRFNDPDAYSLVIASGVESHNRKATTIVELMDEGYRELYKEDNVDGFIKRRDLIKDLLQKDESPKLVRILEKETHLESINELNDKEPGLI